MNEVRFRTFHVIDENGKQISRVMAVTKPLNDDKTKFSAQFSFLSPKDVKWFSKTKGKMIAENRMNSSKEIVFDKLPDRRIHSILKDLILREARRKNIIWMRNLTVENLK